MSGLRLSLRGRLILERGPAELKLCTLCGGAFPRHELARRGYRPGHSMCPECLQNDPVEIVDAIEYAQRDRYPSG